MTEATEQQPPPKLWLAEREGEDIRIATAARLATPNARPGEPPSPHAYVTNCLKEGQVSKFCSCNHCTLAVCSRCGAYEGGLTTHCPDERVDYDTTQAVYTTTLDFTTERGWHMSDEGMRTRNPLFADEQNGVAKS